MTVTVIVCVLVIYYRAGSDGAQASSQTSPKSQANAAAAATNSSMNSQSSETESLRRSQAAANESINASIFVFNNIHSAGIYPASMLEPEKHVPVHGDIYTRKSPEELRYFRDYLFIRFMEGLNKLNRADDRRYLSQAVRAYSESINSQAHSLNDQSVPAVQFIMSTLSNANANANASSSSNPSGSSSSSTGTSTNLSSSQKLVNTLNIPKNMQSPCVHPKKLASPKVKLYDMVARFRVEKESSSSSSSSEKVRAEIRDYLTNEYTSHMTSPDGRPTHSFVSC